MNRSLKIALAMLIVGYLLMAMLFSQHMHFSRAFDEGYHLEYITFIKQHGRLPISYEERSQITRADFPPLYQLLVSWLSTGVNVEGPPVFKFFWDSFRYRVVDHQIDQVWTLETEDLQPPYLGQFLVWQIGRWFSIALSLTTVIVIFVTLRDIPLLNHPPYLPVVGAALIAFVPRYLILGSVLNDDNLLGLFAALYFWMLVKVINHPDRWWPFGAMGVLLGLSMTVKYTLVIVPLEIIIVCVAIAHRRGLGWGWAAQRLALVGILALLSSSWWFGWNIWFLNTVAEDGWFAGILRPLFAGGTDTTLNRVSGLVSGGQVGLTELPEDTIIGTYSGWVRSMFMSFWGAGIAGSIPGYPYVYFLIVLLIGVALFGLWRRWNIEAASHQWLLLFSFHIAVFFVLPLLRFELTRRLSVAAQGRHVLIPAATAIASLLVWGLVTAVPQRWQRPFLGLLVVAFVSWTGVHLYRLVTITTPPPLPLRTVTEAATWLPNPVQANFGEAVELVSYDVAPHPESGELYLELAWRSLAYVNESYLLRVTVLDPTGNVVSHWLGHQGQGRVPTLAWDPGDAVFDRLTLPLPDVPAGTYEVRLQLLGRAGPLTVVEPESEGAEDQGDEENSQAQSLFLTQFILSQATSPVVSDKVEIGNSEVETRNIDLGLWRADGPVEPISNLQSPNPPIPQLPTYRYPGTITLLTQPDVQAELVGPADQVWPATDSVNGIHHFVIGPRWLSGAYQVRLSLPQAEGGIEQAITEPVLMVENWWERQFEKPNVAVPLEANFANQIKFLGYKLPQKQVRAGQSFPVTLYWQAPPDKSPDAEFIQFNQLLDSNGTLWGGYDRQPLEYYNTLLWAPGEVVVDGYAVPVDAEAPPGQYYLNVGYYLTVGESAVNLPLVIDGQMSEQSSVTVGPIEVVESITN